MSDMSENQKVGGIRMFRRIGGSEGSEDYGESEGRRIGGMMRGTAR